MAQGIPLHGLLLHLGLRDFLALTHPQSMLCSPTLPQRLPPKKQSLLNKRAIHHHPTEIAQLMTTETPLQLLPSLDLPIPMKTMGSHRHHRGALAATIRTPDQNHHLDRHQWANSFSPLPLPVFVPRGARFLVPQTCKPLLLMPRTTKGLVYPLSRHTMLGMVIGHPW